MFSSLWVSQIGDDMVKTFGLEGGNLYPFFLSCKKTLDEFSICFCPRALGGVWSTLAEAERNNGVKKSWMWN